MTLDWLTYFPSPARGVWHLGPIPIRAYALCIIVGIVSALLIGDRRWRARGGEPGVIYDIALWAVPFGLIGGRLYHLLTDWRTYFGEGGVGWEATPRIWDGGLGIWGAVALGGVGAWIGCRRRGIPLPAFGDAVAPGIVLAQAIGRIGNYFNQELYGRETTLPWGLEIFWREDAAGVRDPHLLDGVSTGELYKIVQPTFLYELLWNLVVFAVLIYADRRFRMGHGRLFALYIAGYCIGRFGIELLRDDAATHIAGIRVNSFTSTFVLIGAVVYILVATKGREDPEAIRRVWQPPEAEPADATPEAEVEPEAGPDVEQEPELVAAATANGVGSVVRIPKRLSGESDSDIGDSADGPAGEDGGDDGVAEEDVAAEDPDEDGVAADLVESTDVEPEDVEPEIAVSADVEPEAAVSEGDETADADVAEAVDAADEADESDTADAVEEDIAEDAVSEPDEEVDAASDESGDTDEVADEVEADDAEPDGAEPDEAEPGEAEPDEAEPEEVEAGDAEASDQPEE